MNYPAFSWCYCFRWLCCNNFANDSITIARGSCGYVLFYSCSLGGVYLLSLFNLFLVVSVVPVSGDNKTQFQVPIIRLTYFRKKNNNNNYFNKTAQTIKNQEETFNNTTHFRAILCSTYYIQTTYPKDKIQGAVVKVKSEVRRTTFLSRRGWGDLFFVFCFFS